MRRARFIVLIFAIILLASGFQIYKDRFFLIAKNLEIFSSLFKVLNEEYVDELNPNEVIRKGMDKMLDDLDPYTNFISEDMVEDIRTSRTGQYAGVGLTTKRFGNRTIVTETFEGSPAAKSGIVPGDEMMKIDGLDLNKLSPDEIEKLIRGQAGLTLKLTIKKGSTNEIVNLEIRREKIQIKSVSYFGLVDRETGYLSLDEFNAESGAEVKAALLSLKEKGAKQLIIDLRGNPGGLLDQAVSICGLFIPKGSLVVVNKGKTPESNIPYYTKASPIEAEIPIAILIDRSSASASEIVAGTLQDYDRAVIIGERSYGKGLVQTRRPLSFNSFSMITTAKYYTPSGRCIQALDYSNRRKDGSVGSIPDSLRKTFQTKNGRKVYDGGGIDPDIALENSSNPDWLNLLETEGHLLEFGTMYYAKHQNIADPAAFEISEPELESFLNWMEQRSFKFDTDLEKSLKSLQLLAASDKSFGELHEPIKNLDSGIKRFRKKQLAQQKQALKKIITREIVSRYHFKRGAKEASFKYDEELNTAIKLLKNREKFNQILNRSAN